MAAYLGWEHDDEEEAPIATANMKERQAEIDALLKPLCSDNLKATIKFLKKTYVDIQIVRPKDTQFEAAIRQGEANVILHLILNIERINNGG